MKRRGQIIVVAFGLAFGLFLTWLSHYVGSRIDLHSGSRPGGCFDRGDCPSWGVPVLIGYVLLFPALLGVVNGLAWKRWTARKWGGWFAALSLITVAIHLAGYM